MSTYLSMERGDQVEFDAVTAIEPTLTAEVTSYPVEDGSTGADHVVRRPRTVRLECLVTETPDRPLQPVGTTDRPRLVVDRLREAMRRRESVDLLTDLDVIERMYITSLSYPQDVDSQGSVRFSITLQEVEVAVARTAAAKSVPVRRRKSSVRHGSDRQDKGTVATTTATPTRTITVVSGDKSVTKSYAANGKEIQWSGLESMTPVL